jgi:hypothetical protein
LHVAGGCGEDDAGLPGGTGTGRNTGQRQSHASTVAGGGGVLVRPPLDGQRHRGGQPVKQRIRRGRQHRRGLMQMMAVVEVRPFVREHSVALVPAKHP